MAAAPGTTLESTFKTQSVYGINYIIINDIIIVYSLSTVFEVSYHLSIISLTMMKIFVKYIFDRVM